MVNSVSTHAAPAASKEFPAKGGAALPRLLVAFACLFFILQELPWFQSRWVEDESSYSDAAWTFAREGRIRMSMLPPTDTMSQADVRPPAMPIAMGAVFKVVGIGVWQARLLPLVCALGAIVVTFLLGCRLADPWTGAIAALLLSTDTLLFVAARTVRPEAIVAFLNTAAFLVFFAAMRRGSWLLAAAAGLLAGVSINFHINGGIALIGAGLWALYEYGVSVWRRPAAWAFALAAVAAIAPYVIWVNSDPVHQRAYRDMQALGTVVQQASSRFEGEVMRFSDFIGLGNRKVSLPVRVPARAPVAILILAGAAVLFARHRKLFWRLALAVAAALGWWYYLANKNVRYTAVATPLFALMVAGGAVAFSTTRARRRIAVACCLVYAATQIAGNAFVAWRFRTADYVAVARALRSAIPAGETVYGANTFWLALYDRRFYSYDRSMFDYAISDLKPGYLILNDRVLLHGSGFGNDDFRDIREKANEFVRIRADKAATVPNPFYGDLEIYRVRY
jgi:4-amino-4-deoxy-L-arabinose transferase-like glycosyltransferase